MELKIRLSDKARDFVEAIIERMLVLFPITRTEAIGRINQEWRHVKRMDDSDIAFHETVDYWAKTIYYGKDSRWWQSEEGLSPQPYSGPT